MNFYLVILGEDDYRLVKAKSKTNCIRLVAKQLKTNVSNVKTNSYIIEYEIDDVEEIVFGG